MQLWRLELVDPRGGGGRLGRRHAAEAHGRRGERGRGRRVSRRELREERANGEGDEVTVGRRRCDEPVASASRELQREGGRVAELERHVDVAREGLALGAAQTERGIPAHIDRLSATVEPHTRTAHGGAVGAARRKAALEARLRARNEAGDLIAHRWLRAHARRVALVRAPVGRAPRGAYDAADVVRGGREHAALRAEERHARVRRALPAAPLDLAHASRELAAETVARRVTVDAEARSERAAAEWLAGDREQWQRRQAALEVCRCRRAAE